MKKPSNVVDFYAARRRIKGVSGKAPEPREYSVNGRLLTKTEFFDLLRKQTRRYFPHVRSSKWESD
jgi:hypothetical protein